MRDVYQNKAEIKYKMFLLHIVLQDIPGRQNSEYANDLRWVL